MTKLDLDALLQANPKAAKHAESIRQTLQSLEALRGKGLVSKGYTLAPPFGGKAQIPPSKRSKSIARVRLKQTKSA